MLIYIFISVAIVIVYIAFNITFPLSYRFYTFVSQTRVLFNLNVYMQCKVIYDFRRPQCIPDVTELP